ncbi:MAG: transposase [Chitinophagaceae bacterium]|nr:MAG: transposase [Chitinophagaceae bacterium]
MSIGGYKIRDQQAIHFITFAVVEWVDVFTRKAYRDIVIDSLRHCQQEKGLMLHAWCIMTNHVHLLASAKDGDLSNILRDFKKFTSRQIIAAIQANEGESRKDWMLRIFGQAGDANNRNGSYQFWRQDNAPKECFSPAFTAQKIDYIHNNPVQAGLVEKPEDYLYSSAKDYHGKEQSSLLPVVHL